MGRRIRPSLRPTLEPCEPRALPSAITAVMASPSLSPGASRARAVAGLAGGGGGGGGAGTGGGQGSSSSSFASSIALGRSTLSQGPVLNPDGSINNMALAPAGNPKPGERRRQHFTARFVGPYSVVPGRTTAEAIQTLIQGGGTANTMRHSDIQVRLVTPKDRSLPIGGVLTIFDRNINSNTALGFDLSAPQQDVDRGGRPNHFTTLTIDTNESAGVYDEAYAQGVLDVRYIPGGRRTAGAISQGTAVVTIHAQIYAPNASFILRNTSLNP